ncbi:MAG: diguanylate cyclase [Flavobacterium sp.]|nr:diguanylate cyclase [Aeromicrobium sp.]
MMKRTEVDGAEHFTASARKVVDYLNAHMPILDWSVSRVAGGEQVRVHLHRAEITDIGNRRPWHDTFCRRMVNGAARVLVDSQADPDYADLPDAQAFRSYVGSPITDDDGSVFGVLCGVGRDVLAGPDAVDLDLVDLMGGLLSSQLAMARGADRERRNAQMAEALAQTDSLTGLTNRRGWDLLVADAQERVDAYGDLVAVAVIDLDGLKAVNDAEGHGAGDDVLRRAGSALRSVEQPSDRTARYGGDEFAILSNNVAKADLDAHFAVFMQALADHGVSASIGYASVGSGVIDLTDAFAKADAVMYEAKHERKAS